MQGLELYIYCKRKVYSTRLSYLLIGVVMLLIAISGN